MKRMKIAVLLLAMTFVAAAFAGCGTKLGKTDDNSEKVTVETVDTESGNTENIGTENGAEEHDTEATESEPQTETSIFSKVKNYEFWFGSGAGAWCTTLTIQPDGSFSGGYHDSDMGISGTDYPNGTVYQCVFHGNFTEPVAKDDFTYQFEIASIRYDKEPDTEEIIDGVKYIYTDVYGLDDAKEIYLYLPDTPVAELPEKYLEWIWYLDLSKKAGSTLGTYGLYNVSAQEGFSSNFIDEDADIDAELEQLEEEAQQMNDKLQSGELAQLEMNRLSGEIFQLWDDELNSLWSRLKEKLDADAMEELTKEEREWIKWKDQEVKAAGKEMEGGSMQPLLENDKAAELTRKRVYELADKLKSE